MKNSDNKQKASKTNISISDNTELTEKNGHEVATRKQTYINITIPGNPSITMSRNINPNNGDFDNDSPLDIIGVSPDPDSIEANNS